MHHCAFDRSRWLRRRRIAIGRRGVAAAEFAIIGGVVFILMMGVVDVGWWVWQRMQLQGALLAGVHYAQEFPEDTNGMSLAMRAVLPTNLLDAVITPPILSCDCGDDSTKQTGTGMCCPGAQRVFVTISISRPFSPLYFSAITKDELSYAIRIQ